MIMILMEWAYMATLSFLMGFACLAPFRKKGGCQIHSAVTYMMAGLLVLNVYATKGLKTQKAFGAKKTKPSGCCMLV